MRLIKQNRGFTLLELLVVIAIVGLLVTIMTFALKQAQQSARDSKRKSDLENIAVALELYRSDCNAYPGGVSFGGSLAGTGVCAGKTYMTSVPQDTVTGRTYAYSTSGGSYTLCAALEGETTGVSGCGSCGATCSYKITRP